MALKINIGDTWKNTTAIKVNVGDVWKPVTTGYINIGDVWKKFFYSGFTITSSTRLYYKLDNNLLDSSGNGYNGTQSITYTTGLFPLSTHSGIFLSGSTTTITGTTNSEFGFTGDFTVNAWVKPLGVASGYRGIVSRRAQNDSAGWTSNLYQLAIGRYTLVFATAGGGNFYETWAADGTNTSILTGGTYMTTCVRSGVTMSVYVNGLLERAENKASVLNTSFAGNLYVGRTRQTAGEQFNGQIDDIIVENRAWSANEILTYYNGNI